MIDEAMIAGVRSFNRTVTERVGALHDHYLARDRALGEARLLWQIGADGCTRVALVIVPIPTTANGIANGPVYTPEVLVHSDGHL